MQGLEFRSLHLIKGAMLELSGKRWYNTVVSWFYIITLIISIGAFCVAFGKQAQRVTQNEKEIRESKIEFKQIREKVEDIQNKVTFIAAKNGMDLR